MTFTFDTALGKTFWSPFTLLIILFITFSVKASNVSNYTLVAYLSNTGLDHNPCNINKLLYQNYIKFQGSENPIMKDQLMNRKFKGLKYPLYHPPVFKKQTQKIIVMSGKNNVGKSLFCRLFSWILSLKDERTLLIDCDFQNSKLDELFRSASDSRLLSTDENRTKISNNLDFMSCKELQAALTEDPLLSLSEYIEFISTGYDFIIIDSQTGLSDLNLELLIFADTGILITTPDPSALLDTYMLIRGSLSHIDAPDFRLVMNQILSSSEVIELYDNLNTALANFLNFEIGLIGKIPFDTSLDFSSVKLTAEFEDSTAIREMEKIVSLVRTVKSKTPQVTGAHISVPAYRGQI